MTLLLLVLDDMSALFLDHPLEAILCLIGILALVLCVLLWISLTGYDVIDRAYRRKIRKHVLVVGKCPIPAHEEITYVGTNSNTRVVEFRREMVPDEWRVMIQTGGKKAVCLVTKEQFEVVSLGNMPLARFYIGRLSRQVFVLELKI